MSVDTIILDEYDELLSDSQIQFVKKISHHVPRDHQMIYMSATNKVPVQSLEKNTKVIDLSDQDLSAIEHFYLSVDKRDKVDLLRKFSNLPDFRALVFFNSLSDLGASEEKLQFNGASAVSLASDISVPFRKTILEKFKQHDIKLLLATDLVARGIDIDNLEYVINFEVARDKENYIHRAGRTGRMGKSGRVITLVSHPEDIKKLKKFASVSELTLKHQKFQIK